MELKGRVWKFGKDVDTDELFAGRYIMGGDETSKSQYQEFIAKSGLSDVGHREATIAALEQAAIAWWAWSPARRLWARFPDLAGAPGARPEEAAIVVP